MFVKPTLAEHKNHIHILSLLAELWANVGPTKKPHTAHKKLTLAQHWPNKKTDVGPTLDYNLPTLNYNLLTLAQRAK